MDRYYLLLLAFLSSLGFVGAQDIRLNNAVMAAGGGTFILTSGDIVIDNNASIQNFGTIRLGGDWINNAAGLNSSLPGTVEFNGSVAQIIGGANTTGFFYLDINNNSGIFLNRNANVFGRLNFLSGKINTGSFFVNMNTAPQIAITGANPVSYVNGNLVMIFPAGSYTYKYEIGNTVYAPAVFRVNGLAATAGVLGFTVAGDGPYENVPFANASLIDPFAKVNQYWAFEATPAAFTDFELEFDFTYTSNTGDPLQYVARRYTSASLWNNTTGSLTSALKYKVTALPDLGEFVIGEVSSTGITENQLFGITMNNPMNDVLMISNAGQLPVLSLLLIDLHGRKIYQQNTVSNNDQLFAIDVKDLASGIYFMTIQFADGNRFSRKLIKE